MRTIPFLGLLAFFLFANTALAQTGAPGERLPPLPAVSAADPAPAQPATPEPPPAGNAAPDSSATPRGAAPPVAPPMTFQPTPPIPETPAGTCLCPVFVHQGFYLGVGNGLGHLALSGDGPNGSASISGFASTSSIAVGGSPIRGLAITGIIQGATRTGSRFDGGPQWTATTSTVVNGQSKQTTTALSGRAAASSFLLGVAVDWFPKAEDGWHVGAALGLGGAGIVDDVGNAIAGASVAASVFGGYQWWLGRAWSLGVSGLVSGAPSVKMNDSNGIDSGYRMLPVWVGVQSLLLYY